MTRALSLNHLCYGHIASEKSPEVAAPQRDRSRASSMTGALQSVHTKCWGYGEVPSQGKL